MTGFEVASLTCKVEDTNWSMKLPYATTSDVSPVEVEMLSSSDHADMFHNNGGTIELDSSWLKAGCPSVTKSSITLKFRLTSSLLGKND